MQTFYFTDPGKVRSHNEDSVTIINNDKSEFVLAIADGMGGHKAGEVASMIAINHIRDSFYKLDTAYLSRKKEKYLECLNLRNKNPRDKSPS